MVLRKIYGAQSPITLFLSKVSEVHLKARIDGPPFDPHTCAKALNIRVTEEDGMAMDGLLRYREREGFEIALREHQPPARKRFTLAHEIAHTFFYLELLEFDDKYRPGLGYDREGEFLCDLAAAELLMPARTFKRDLELKAQDGRITPSTVLELRDLYQVSLQAVCTRIARLRKDLICAIWNLESKAIHLEWVAPSCTRPLVLCHTGHSSVERAFDRSGEVVDGFDCFYLKGKRAVRKTFSRSFRSGGALSILQSGVCRRKKHHDARPEDPRNENSDTGQREFHWSALRANLVP
jgi:Zn-dependent peptidase ImmA (M78 family)